MSLRDRSSARHAADLLHRGCHDGLRVACEELVAIDVPIDPSWILSARTVLCASGDPPSCLLAGTLLAIVSSRDSLIDAAGRFADGCRAAVAAACDPLVSVGRRFATGAKAPLDTALAAGTFDQACNLSKAVGCVLLRDIAMPLAGAADAPRQEQGIEGYRTACANLDLIACDSLWSVASRAQALPALQPRARKVWSWLCDIYARRGSCSALAQMLTAAAGGPRDSVRALALYTRDCSTAPVPDTDPACIARYQVEGGLNTVVLPTIVNPDVQHLWSFYPACRFRPMDEIILGAGGCAQTGGHGKTWKRYVDPRPADEGLYYGMYRIPFVAGQEGRLSNVIGRVIRVPADYPPEHLNDLFLALGYRDGANDYKDNGYYGHDNGNPEQCVNVFGAWVSVTVRHHTAPPPKGLVLAEMGNMDLWWDIQDPNVLPLNPRWKTQIVPAYARPDAGPLCNYFEYDEANDKLAVDFPSCIQRWMPTVDISTNNAAMEAVCRHDIKQLEPLHANSVRGHVNWMPVTYTGALYFDDHNGGLTGDDDWDLSLSRPDEAGAAHNVVLDHHADRPPLGIEFDTDEVTDNIDSGWWYDFNKAVDLSDATGRWVMDGNRAKVIGLLGLDTKHNIHAELHPVYVMAVQVPHAPGRERWVFWARNWGNEGGCGNNQHLLDKSQVSLLFEGVNEVAGLPPGIRATSVSRAPSRERRQAAGRLRNTALVTWRHAGTDSIVVTFHLGDASAQPLMWGELELCQRACNAPPVTVAEPAPRVLLNAPPPSEKDDKDYSSLEPLAALMSRRQRKVFEAELRAAVRDLAYVQSQQQRVTVPLRQVERGAEPAVVHLWPGEQRVPERTLPRPDEMGDARRERQWRAIVVAMGSERAANELVAKWKRRRRDVERDNRSNER